MTLIGHWLVSWKGLCSGDDGGKESLTLLPLLQPQSLTQRASSEWAFTKKQTFFHNLVLLV